MVKSKYIGYFSNKIKFVGIIETRVNQHNCKRIHHNIILIRVYIQTTKLQIMDEFRLHGNRSVYTVHLLGDDPQTIHREVVGRFEN